MDISSSPVPVGLSQHALEAAIVDLKSRDPRRRAAAANALGDAEQGDAASRAAEALVLILSDDRFEVRCAAALALGDLGDPIALDPLLELMTDENREVRQAAVVALGRIGDDRAFDPLARALLDGPPDVRFQAAISLVEIDRQRAFEPLVSAVRDGDAEVRGNVAAALGLIGDRRAAGWLTELLDDDRRETRFEAACSLARMEDGRALEPLLDFLSDDTLSCLAIEALNQLGDPRAAHALHAVTKRWFLPRIFKMKAAAALLAIAPDHEGAVYARKLLEKGLRSRHDVVRSVAKEALARGSGEHQCS
ncbi:MAG: HEAT repeat domain-containing protein [Deltaproteobacteria bacterium]|nr:HEAT repeat domain-containing protein [Deltaproteobacteria bacterium]